MCNLIQHGPHCGDGVGRAVWGHSTVQRESSLELLKYNPSLWHFLWQSFEGHTKCPTNVILFTAYDLIQNNHTVLHTAVQGTFFRFIPPYSITNYSVLKSGQTRALSHLAGTWTLCHQCSLSYPGCGCPVSGPAPWPESSLPPGNERPCSLQATLTEAPGREEKHMTVRLPLLQLWIPIWDEPNDWRGSGYIFIPLDTKAREFTELELSPSAAESLN